MFLIKLFTFSFSIWAADVTAYNLNLKTNQCDPSFQEGPAKKPTALKDYKKISPEIFEKIPSCKNQKSCISPERLELLSSKELIPTGLNTTNIINGPFKQKQKSLCYSRDPFQNLEPFAIAGNSIMDNKKIFPAETTSSYNLVVKTKAVVDQYLKESEIANKVLLKCFELNSKYEQQGLTEDRRLAQYQTDTKNNPQTPKACDSIWIENSGVRNLGKNLKEMRQNLALIQAIESGRFKDLNDFERVLLELKNRDEKNTFKKRALAMPLKPIKGELLGRFTMSSFWKNTPNQLEPLNESEKETLLETYTDTISKSPKEITNLDDLKTVLYQKYYSQISEAPILIHFGNARPTAKEIQKAFADYNDKTKEVSELNISDVDYLNFSQALAAVIENEPENQRGDLCLLAGAMIQSRKSIKELPENLLFALWGFETFGATLVAKGAIKKLIGLFFGARYAGVGMGINQVQKGFEKLSTNEQTCLRTGFTSNGMCHSEGIENGSNELIIGATLTTVFGVRNPFKKKLPKDSTSKEDL